MSGFASVRSAGSAALLILALAALLLLPAATSHAERSSARGFGGGYHAQVGSGHAYGGERHFYGGAGRGYAGGGGWQHGGGLRYYRPYGCRYIRPHTYFRIGIGFGRPYYHHPRVYGYAVEPRHVYVDPGADFDVTNYAPNGCYYRDPFCDERFSTLDDYTDHLDRSGHAATLEIIDERSGDRLRTLEYVDGEWAVRN